MNDLNAHVRALELGIRIGLVDARLLRPLATLLVRQNKCQFRLSDDCDKNTWKDYIITGEKLQNLTMSYFLKEVVESLPQNEMNRK